MRPRTFIRDGTFIRDPGDKSEVDRFVNADLRHSRESNENELANYPEPPARGA